MTDDEALRALAFGKDDDLIPAQVSNMRNSEVVSFNSFKAIRFLARRIYRLENP